jgi:hypothetical protein
MVTTFRRYRIEPWVSVNPIGENVLSKNSLRVYWLLGLAVGDAAGAGGGVTFEQSIRMFQSSPSRITAQYPLISVGPNFSP